jgi:HSP20 family protein
MARQRTVSLDPFTVLRGAVDRLFDTFPYFDGGQPFRAAAGFPALNIWDDENNLYVEAEIPGVKAEDLEAYAIGRELTIKGRRASLQDPKALYHRQERGTGEFARVMELPVDVDANGVQASLKDGILTVTLPKAREAKPRRIEVKAT